MGPRKGLDTDRKGPKSELYGWPLLVASEPEPEPEQRLEASSSDSQTISGSSPHGKKKKKEKEEEEEEEEEEEGGGGGARSLLLFVWLVGWLALVFLAPHPHPQIRVSLKHRIYLPLLPELSFIFNVSVGGFVRVNADGRCP